MKKSDPPPAASGTGQETLRTGKATAHAEEEIAEKTTDGIQEAIARLFDLDMDSDASRVRLAAQHPMLEQQYVGSTPEIDHFYDLCYDWVMTRKSGLYVYGPYRIGKSKAIESVITSLKDEFPYTTFVNCIGQRNLHQSKEAFCRYLLDCWGVTVGTLRRGERVEPLLLNYLMSLCEMAGGNLCVFFIDEAQLFSVLHYRYLLELWNSLRNKGYILSTILVGQPELLDLKALTNETDHGAVVSRFFVKGYSIEGIKNEHMLSDFLANYDDKLFYPLNSAWSYSRYFMRSAYDHGWRLKQEGPMFWKALCLESKADAKKIAQTGFRMAWIVDAIHGFLLDNMKVDKPKFSGTVDNWQELLSVSTDRTLLI